MKPFLKGKEITSFSAGYATGPVLSIVLINSCNPRYNQFGRYIYIYNIHIKHIKTYKTYKCIDVYHFLHIIGE